MIPTDTLIYESELKKAKEKALSLLSYKEYTSSELCKRLSKYINPEIAELATERMVELGLINDYDYAMRYARKLGERQNLGEKRIRMEMRQKGLSDENITEAISQLDCNPIEQAKEFMGKKYPLWQEDECVKRRAYGALVRRGFALDDIRSAMRKTEYD